MGRCPKNTITGKPDMYGHTACPIRQRVFVTWAKGSSPPKPLYKRICDDCGQDFSIEPEEIQISEKAG